MTDKYAVIGNPIAHSKSPQIHMMFAQQTGEDVSYEAILAPLDGFSATIDRLRLDGYRGCNVTVPFKFEAYNFVKELEDTVPLHGVCDQTATNAHAANTLTFGENFIAANNTDGTGLVNDIQHNLHIPLADKRILLLGAGGAAYGVLQPLLQRHPRRLLIANRTLEKAAILVRRYADPSNTALSACTFAAIREEFDIVINATSSGLTNEMPPLPPGIFASGSLAYDLMYGRETAFMTYARQQHAALVADGLGMLVEQAAEAFHIWRGIRPRTAPIIASLR